MKYLVFIFAIFFSASIVMAACSSPSQTIVTMYKSNNSHLAIFNSTFNDSNAQQFICFDQIFEYSNTESNPWTSNEILTLSGIRNAHAEVVGESNYNVPLNYKGLSCDIETLSGCGGQYERPVLSLSGDTNAHGAIAGFGSYSSNVLCCSPEFTITEAKWKSVGGNELSQACVGNTVRLHVKGEGIANKANVTISHENTVNGLNKKSLPVIEMDLTNGEGNLNFYLNNSYNEGDNRNFTFKVEVMDNDLTSNELLVLGSACSSDETLNINITGMDDRMAYFTGIQNTINYSVDPTQDYGIIFNWSIPQDNFNTNAGSFNRTFNTAGQKTIILDAVNAYGARAHEEITILALGGTGDVQVMSYIDEPTRRALLDAHGTITVVNFSGEGSYVLESKMDLNTCGGSVDCIAGNCPAKMNNSCSASDIPITLGGTGTYENMNYAWNRNENGNGFVLGGLGAKNGFMIYTNSMYSKAEHDKLLKLGLVYQSASSNESREFTVGRCIMDNWGYIKTISNGIAIKVNTADLLNVPSRFKIGTYNPDVCKGEDKINGTSDDCCPNGYYCSTSEGCKLMPATQPRITRCSDLMSINACNNWSYMNLLGTRVSSIGSCGVQSQGCEWNGTCKDVIISYNITTAIENARKMISYTNASSCDAASGYWQMDKVTTCSGTCPLGGECGTNETIYVKCGVPMFDVPFFGVYELLISVLGIFGVYFIARRK